MNTKLGELQRLKNEREKIVALTAYDYPTARLLDESGVDLLLVGDSLGMVVLGYPDTTCVTMEEMLHHTRAVARGVKRAPVLVDLPFGSCDNVPDAVANARRLIEAGGDAVKLEGGASHVAQIEALVADGIPVMAHIGMQPQRVRIEGGYRVKGKTAPEADGLLQDARAVESAGCFALLLELVTPDVASAITAALRIPTIGIGAGTGCDGQVLVTHDLLGLFPWFTPRFAKPRAALASEIQRAAREFIDATKNRAS